MKLHRLLALQARRVGLPQRLESRRIAFHRGFFQQVAIHPRLQFIEFDSTRNAALAQLGQQRCQRFEIAQALVGLAQQMQHKGVLAAVLLSPFQGRQRLLVLPGVQLELGLREVHRNPRRALAAGGLGEIASHRLGLAQPIRGARREQIVEQRRFAEAGAAQ